jgi:hypothetical protein
MATRLKRAAAFAFLAVSAAFVASACDVFTSVGPKSCDSNPEDNRPTAYDQGTVTDGIYMSSPWTGPLLYFPGGMKYQIKHHLGTTPQVWNAYLSFDKFGIKSDTVSQAAGNEVEATFIDADHIDVLNMTCSDFWLIVTAQASATPQPGG